MKSEKLHITVQTYTDRDELPETSRMLIDNAIEAASGAWAPYSGFHVGAALILENGEVISGNNQENGAFPSGLCAERVALYYAGANFPGVAVQRIAIAALDHGAPTTEPVYPCGSCRQALLEIEHRTGKPVEIIMVGSSEVKVVSSIADLLPLPFRYGS